MKICSRYILKIFSFAFLLKIGTVLWRNCTKPVSRSVCTYIHKCVYSDLQLYMRFLYSYRRVHTPTYIHTWEKPVPVTGSHQHTLGKQHCKILVRFFTRRRRHLFPSLALGYVDSLILSLTLQGTHLDISSRRASDGTLLTHCF